MKPENLKYIVLIVLLVVGGLFYWFQYRPSEIRKHCVRLVQEFEGEYYVKHGVFPSNEGSNDIYRQCLVGKGMSPEDLLGY